MESVIRPAHLITKGVSPDHDGVHPARNGFGHAGQDDGFTENRAAQDVANLRWMTDRERGYFLR